MKWGRALRAVAGVLLCVVGFILARGTPYRQTSVIIDAGGCRLATDVIDDGNDETKGSVILLHGLAANRKLMSYLAHAFAEENLRVFVPDLPGHGRTPPPFSFGRAEECSEAFLRQLIAHGVIDPARTIVAGHSMGGAIAFRVAARVRVAGVIVLSPAPMSSAHGLPPEMLLFPKAPPAPPNTLVMSASGDLRSARESASDLMKTETGADSPTGAYEVLPRATHVSLLFDSRVARRFQEWAAQVLHFASDHRPPSALPLVGGLAGFVGLVLLSGPFLRETVGAGTVRGAESKNPESSRASRPDCPEAESPALWRTAVETAVASVAIVALLKVVPILRFVGVFEGDYLSGFMLLLGAILVAVHHKLCKEVLRAEWRPVIAAAIAGLMLLLLFTGWFDATTSEAWLTALRWLRFPVFIVAVLPYLYAEELLVPGPAQASSARRLMAGLALRGVAWLVMAAAIFALHSGEILLVLLAPYLGVLAVLQRMGMNIVRKETQSPEAAAVFGATILAGFFLVIFPST